MNQRRGTVRVAHRRGCKNASQTSLESLEGCTCVPSYYFFHRSSGRPVKGPRVGSYAEAQHLLKKSLRRYQEDAAAWEKETGADVTDTRVTLALDAATLERLADLVEPIIRERLARETPAAPSLSPFLTIVEAAEFLRTKRQRVDDLLSSGRLTRHKDGARTLIERAELERYVGFGGR